MVPKTLRIGEADLEYRWVGETYLLGDLARRMARYHRDPDKTFWGWNDIWLSDEFRDWNIEGCLGRIECPVLVIQGRDDEFGTVAEVEAIRNGVSGPVEAVVLDDCGHSPHRQKPEQTLEEVVRFVRNVPGTASRLPA